MNVKFAANVGIGQTVETASSASLFIDYCMFRVSEVILMKAEALAQQGGSANAALDPLIQERTNGRYTAATYPYPSDVTSELQKVQLQTRIEMWGESGLEWFNNHRWNIPVNRQGSANHWNPAMQFSVSQMTMSIPMQEINTNPNLVLD